jgi:hypothetical protein
MYSELDILTLGSFAKKLLTILGKFDIIELNSGNSEMKFTPSVFSWGIYPNFTSPAGNNLLANCQSQTGTAGAAAQSSFFLIKSIEHYF